MEISSGFDERQSDISGLFRETFSASEGAEEGEVIGKLSADLIASTAPDDIFVFFALDAERCIGAIIFSRLRYSDDPRSVFVLGPVAVAPDQQGTGVGQVLLRHGLDALRVEGVEVAVTYGDPNYYAKVGFAPISETEIAAPFALQYPEGWLGQSLTGTKYLPIKGTCRCVAAFDDPAYW